MARRAIQEHAQRDQDKWFYANRYVFARLALDERKTKTAVKRELLNATGASIIDCYALARNICA